MQQQGNNSAREEPTKLGSDLIIMLMVRISWRDWIFCLQGFRGLDEAALHDTRTGFICERKG